MKSNFFLSKTKGRLFEEVGCNFRTDFQRDRDRIIHSGAFRRLKDKSQVFVENQGDNFRTRLTHSIEVAQIARSISNSLNLNIDLAEAIALSHDLGHPPFGHTGEEALDKCMKEFGGFDHNIHALKIVTKIEKKYACFDGLNLTWETLEGIVKHNGPIEGKLHRYLKNYNKSHDLHLNQFPSLEAQVANISDDIAYNNHDLLDGINFEIFDLEELLTLPLIGDCFLEIKKKYPKIDKSRVKHEVFRKVLNIMISDVVFTSSRKINLISKDKKSFLLTEKLVCFSESLEDDIKVIKKFLFDKMYRHWTVRRMRTKVSKIIYILFEIFMNEPQLLPPDWFKLIRNSDYKNDASDVICDYIAGMTDRFALHEFNKLTV